MTFPICMSNHLAIPLRWAELSSTSWAMLDYCWPPVRRALCLVVVYYIFQCVVYLCSFRHVPCCCVCSVILADITRPMSTPEATLLPMNYRSIHGEAQSTSCFDSHAHAMWVYGMAKALGWPAVYQTFTANRLSCTKTLIQIYRFRATTFLWCRYFWGKMNLLPKN